MYNKEFLIFQQKRRKRYYRIDRFFLVIFPLMFVAFNVCYWIYYFSFNPMNILNEIYSHEEADGTVTAEELLGPSTTISPEMSQV